jgi:hypothetical protein
MDNGSLPSPHINKTLENKISHRLKSHFPKKKSYSQDPEVLLISMIAVSLS